MRETEERFLMLLQDFIGYLLNRQAASGDCTPDRVTRIRLPTNQTPPYLTEDYLSC